MKTPQMLFDKENVKLFHKYCPIATSLVVSPKLVLE